MFSKGLFDTVVKSRDCVGKSSCERILQFLSSSRYMSFGLGKEGPMHSCNALQQGTSTYSFYGIVEDKATMGLILYFKNRVSYFVQNRRK